MRTIEQIRSIILTNYGHPGVLSWREGIDGLAACLQSINGTLQIIASWGMGWEHVSVSLPTEHRCLDWGEMCHVKGLFWNDDETVIQYHPAKQDYVNCHPFVLHLWKPIGIELPKPPTILIGPKL
jgi:hypothetical protein